MNGHIHARLPEVDRKAAARLWQSYCAATGWPVDWPYTVEYFGDNPQLCDALLDEVASGRKRATSSLEQEYAAAEEPVPEVDSHWIACDATGTPRLIIRTTGVRLLAFTEVDAGFAFAEGEEDRSLASWRREHERYWRRTEAAAGRGWNPEATGRPGHRVVCERFEVAWPVKAGVPR